MGNWYGKNKVLYAGICFVDDHPDSLIVTSWCSALSPHNFMEFKILKSNVNMQKISEIISKYKNSKRVLKFIYDSEFQWNMLTDINVVDECEENMKFVNKISYVHDNKFDELVFDKPGTFIVHTNTNAELIPGSIYKVRYIWNIGVKIITSYSLVGCDNKLVNKQGQFAELEL